MHDHVLHGQQREHIARDAQRHTAHKVLQQIIVIRLAKPLSRVRESRVIDDELHLDLRRIIRTEFKIRTEVEQIVQRIDVKDQL